MEGKSKGLTARRALALALACAAGAYSATASAASVPLVLPNISLVAGMTACQPLLPEAQSPLAPLAASKATAILGGARSALETMRSQQANVLDIGPLLPVQASATIRPLEPAAGMAPNSQTCDIPRSPALAFALPRPAASSGGLRKDAGPDDFLGSRRIAIGHTYFDTEWSRVRKEKVALTRELGRQFGRTGDIESRLAAVNGWVNKAIQYTEDRDLFGVADHWAGPKRTLALRKGDCEDYALLKMHLLAAAGIKSEDMYLTIARDLARRADHAVLVVRTDHGYRMLDNATDTVLDAGQALDYRPVLSFSDNRRWIHGYAS